MAEKKTARRDSHDDAADITDDDRLALQKLGFQIPDNGNLSNQWKAFLKAQAGADEDSPVKK